MLAPIMAPLYIYMYMYICMNLPGPYHTASQFVSRPCEVMHVHICILAEVFAIVHVCKHVLVYMYSVHVHGVLPVLVCVLVFCLVHVCEHVHVHVHATPEQCA